MSHTCHAYKCTTPVDPSMHMCRRHWFMVPTDARRRLWAAYRRGQETDKVITRAYAEAAQACIDAVAVKEGHIKPGQSLVIVYSGVTVKE